jgi:hypothetical protein
MLDYLGNIRVLAMSLSPERMFRLETIGIGLSRLVIVF